MSEQIAISTETIRLPGKGDKPGREVPPNTEFKRGESALPTRDFDRLRKKGVLVPREIQEAPAGDEDNAGEVEKLVALNADELIRELPNVEDGTLMELEGAESNGKDRSTVREAISEELDRRSGE